MIMTSAADRPQAVTLSDKLDAFDALWSPKRIARVNDYEVKLAKGEGDFPRHEHTDTDELFLVLKGSLTIRMDAGDVVLGPGELYVIPRGVEHAPHAAPGTAFLLLEPAGVVNTGDAGGLLTATVEDI
jgi:mannose-6-phosphate isomerase-like protein (cupin superfamily)